MKIQDKRATSGDVYVSPVLIIIWIAIAVSIAVGVILFYNAQADVRIIEADALSTKILDCLVKDFNYSEVSEKSFDMYKKCRLNTNVLEKSDRYYIAFSVNDPSLNKVISAFWGVEAISTQCEYQLENNILEKSFAQCSKKSAIIADEFGKKYLLEVVTASNQQ